MGKISPVSAKYIIHVAIDIDGVVDRPDVVGAIFGQTEGLLGADLELRELQKSGRIGRIEVNVDTRNGKTKGNIVIPSSLDKAETSIIAAAMEIIQRIGPCNAKIHVDNIEDVRVSKRVFVIERAKELLRNLMEKSIPDSQELSDEVAYSVRVMEIREYGKDRLPSGPLIDESDEIIVVEGRADILNLLKHGFKNAIAMNGTSVPETIIDLCKKKVVTLFVDGDRGGDLIIKEFTSIADVDFVTKAPDGKEVEEITKKEIHKALRSRISGEQAKFELSKDIERIESKPFPRPISRPQIQKSFSFPQDQKKIFKIMLENLVGTRGAQVIDEKMNTLCRIPISELQTTMRTLKNNAYAIVFDGIIDKDIVRTAESEHIRCLIGMDSKIKNSETRINILTSAEL